MSDVKKLADQLLKNISKHQKNPHKLDAERHERSRKVKPAKLRGANVEIPEMDENGIIPQKKQPKPPMKKSDGLLREPYTDLAKSKFVYVRPARRAIRLEWK